MGIVGPGRGRAEEIRERRKVGNIKDEREETYLVFFGRNKNTKLNRPEPYTAQKKRISISATAPRARKNVVGRGVHVERQSSYERTTKSLYASMIHHNPSEGSKSQIANHESKRQSQPHIELESPPSFPAPAQTYESKDIGNNVLTKRRASPQKRLREGTTWQNLGIGPAYS